MHSGAVSGGEPAAYSRRWCGVSPGIDRLAHDGVLALVGLGISAMPRPPDEEPQQLLVNHAAIGYKPPLPSLPAVDASVPNVGVWKLTALTFFAVAGGPYGIEPLVQSGGAMWAIIGLAVAPIVWGFPVALMTAELSTALPESGGYIVWVHRAFGDFWTVQMSVWSLVNSLLDNAMYPIMFVDYISAFREKSWNDGRQDMATGSSAVSGDIANNDSGEEPITIERWLLGMSMVVPIFLMNVRGVDLAGDFAISFAFLVIAPFVVMVVMGIPEISPDKIMAPADPKTQDWGAYITVLLWNECGFDSAGTLAAEVSDPGAVYVPAMMISMVLVTLVYMLPIIVGVCAVPDSTRWFDGAWTAIGYAIGHGWLAGWVTFAGAVSCAGQLNTNFATNGAAIAAMGRTGVMPAVLGRTLPGWDTPWVALVFQLLVQCVLMCGDFSSILQANMVTYNFTIVLEFAACIKLRLVEPDLARPYRIPCSSSWGLVLLFLPPTLLTVLLLCLCEWKILGASACVIAVGFAYYVAQVSIYIYTAIVQ